jgi:hypothetical protein
MARPGHLFKSMQPEARLPREPPLGWSTGGAAMLGHLLGILVPELLEMASLTSGQWRLVIEPRHRFDTYSVVNDRLQIREREGVFQELTITFAEYKVPSEKPPIGTAGCFLSNCDFVMLPSRQYRSDRCARSAVEAIARDVRAHILGEVRDS